MARVYHILIFLLLFSSSASARATSVYIRIHDQQSFSQLDSIIKGKITGKPDIIDVQLDDRVYYFHENHLHFDGIQAANTSIRISGTNAILLPQLNDEPAPFDINASYYLNPDGTPQIIIPHEEMERAHFFVRVVDREKKICRIRINRAIPKEQIKDGYIYLTQWFRGGTYKITDVKGKYLYFFAHDLKPVRFLYSVNTDWTFSLQFPRFKLINCESRTPSNLRAIATTFLSVKNTTLNSLVVSGLSFSGNKYVPDSKEGLISFYHSDLKTTIERCTFSGIRSICIAVKQTNDVLVTHSIFTDCFRSCMKVWEGCARNNFMHNRIDRAGLCGDNVSAIINYGEDFLIDNNVISDFGYGAIAVGLHFTVDKTTTVSGVISNNEIFQTPAYFKKAPETLLMDSGAINISTQNDRIVISDNYVHDINGPTYNRGIFADDGASNITITRNHISGIRNFYALDIDPRSAWKMMHRKNRKVNTAHEGLVIEDNVVEGKYRIP